MNLIDSHCHLPKLRHQKYLEEVLNGAKEWEVTKFINIGASLKENAEASEVAQKYENIYASAGIYPHEHLEENPQDLIRGLEKQVSELKKVVAIGECGIDITNWERQRPLEKQKELFKWQAELALKLDLPLIVHNRNGSEHVLEILSAYKNVRGVVHCFDANWEVAQKFLNLGFYLSFSGLITYKSKNALLEVVRNVPEDKYLIETDSPYLLPEPAKTEEPKKKNEPKYVKIVGQKAAEVRQMSLEKVALQTCTNTNRLFEIKS
jgi:TatD DNase family protein